MESKETSLKQISEIINELINFMQQAVIGEECGFYRAYSYLGMVGEFTNSSTNFILSSFVFEYLNACYERLVRSEDQYLVKIFDPVQNMLHHSITCTIIIIGNYINFLYQIIDRKNLDVSSIDKLEESWNLQMKNGKIKILFDDFREKLIKHYSQVSSLGKKNINDEDPNEILFKMVMKGEIGERKKLQKLLDSLRTLRALLVPNLPSILSSLFSGQ